MDNVEVPKEDKYDIAHTGAKAVLNLIPFVGGTVTEVFNALVSPPIEKRKREWMEEVVNALQHLEDNQTGLVQQLASNEEFASLLISASINAYKTHLKEKHIKLKNALINSIDDKTTFDIKQVYINFIDELTLPHLEVLQFISDFEDRIRDVNEYQKIYNILTEGTIDPTVPWMSKLEITTFRFLLKDLEAKGLIFISDDMRDLENQVSESSFLLLENGDKSELPFIRITTFGRAFLNFISEGESRSKRAH